MFTPIVWCFNLLSWFPLLLHYGEIMHIDVARYAFGEPAVDLLFMGCAVTLAALRHKAVFRIVTGYTAHFAVLARGLLPRGVDLGVAGTAGDRRHVRSIIDQHRLVNGMARGAGRQLLTFMVRLVAAETGRFVAVGSVAFLATEPGVFARKLGELILRPRVAFAASIEQPRLHGNLFRRMGVRMAAGAVGKSFAMQIGMA